MITSIRNARAALCASCLSVVALVSGCGPAFHGHYPPPGYYGGPVQQMAPVPATPPTMVVPQGGSGAPATFNNNVPTPSNLNEIPSVSPADALNLPPTPKATTWHTVKTGETLSSISKSYGVPLDVLMKANFFDEAPNLTPGQHIMIP